MEVYEEDSDNFSKEYLDYLKTLTSEVFKGSVRITRNPKGEPVRLEFWFNDGAGYLNFHLPGWMEVDDE